MWIGGDLDTFSIREGVVEWDDMTIYLGDGELVSELRVDSIGEVYRRCSLREGDDISARREDEYLI